MAKAEKLKEPRILFDSRWVGSHGIARFASEVRIRSQLEFVDFKSSIRPTSMLDVVNVKRLLLPTKDILFNPGFNVGLGLAKQVSTLHDLILIEEQTSRQKLNRLYFESVIRPSILKSKLVFTVSETSKSAIEEWINDPEVTVLNVGNGISEVFHQDWSPSSQKTGNKVLYVGNLRSHKNLLTLLSAMQKLPTFQLRLIVPKAEIQSVKSLLANFSLASRCTVESGLSDVELLRAYRESDILAFPSRREGFGLPVAESICAGTPVVFSNECLSVAEIAKGYGTGVSESMSPDSWASAIEHELRLGRRVQPSDMWKSKYKWGSVSRKIDGALLTLAHQIV